MNIALMHRHLLVCALMGTFLPSISCASFIETTMGTAVVNDATAAYFNPAALVLLKNSQLIPLGTVVRFQSQFKGQSQAVATHVAESGTSNSSTQYYSPSFYVGVPLNQYVTLGFAAVSNFANRDPEAHSILRYTQSSNTIQDYDVVPSIGIKLNDYFSIGAGVNYSYTNFNLHPILGLPGLNIADSQSHNQSDGSGVGANIGFLLKPMAGTLIGFDYRTVTTYRESGKSAINGMISVSSNQYQFTMHTPARSILSVSHLFTPTWGMIATVQRVQWSIVTNIHVSGIATLVGHVPAIKNASIPFYLSDVWLLTLGGNYRFKPNWIVRVAATYSQSPDSGRYQVSTGDSYILGTSLGYKVNDRITLDGSYAHAFMQRQSIDIQGARYLIMGNNEGSRDVVALKVTLNL